MACHLQTDADPDPAYHFGVDPDPGPTFEFDSDPCGSGSATYVLVKCEIKIKHLVPYVDHIQ